MRITTIQIQDKEVGIYYVNAITAGYGHKKITVELTYNDKHQQFHETINDMPAFDEADELEGEEKDIAFYNLIKNAIQAEVEDWIENL